MLQDSTQFRPGPPYAVTDKAYTADFNEVKALGGDGTTTPSARTANQTAIALYWWESSPLKWSRIARVVAVASGPPRSTSSLCTEGCTGVPRRTGAGGADAALLTVTDLDRVRGDPASALGT